MELHERMNHHASNDLMLGLVQDRYGQLRPVLGQGFKHGRIYQEIDDRNGIVEKIWIEDTQGRVVFEARRKNTLAEVLYLRDTAFPGHTVCRYHGQHQATPRVDDPEWGQGAGRAGVTFYRAGKQLQQARCEINSKSKCKKSRKIKRAGL